MFGGHTHSYEWGPVRDGITYAVIGVTGHDGSSPRERRDALLLLHRVAKARPRPASAPLAVRIDYRNGPNGSVASRPELLMDRALGGRDCFETHLQQLPGVLADAFG